jgi:hypothetical protein
MAPVEIESIPSLPVAATTSSLKTVDKALELPIIHDAVNMATKLHQQATQYPTYNQVEAIVANGVSMVDKGLSEGVKSTVATAVSSLDDLASTGLDKLTTSVPALSTPTEEILPTITGSISASTATDYVASFEVVQTGLKLADTALSLGEKGLKTFAPSLEEGSLAGGVVKQMRVVRRTLRAIRHGGRREAGHTDEEEEKDVDLTSWKKWIINVLHINAILGIFGMSLDEDKTEEPVAIPISRSWACARSVLAFLDNPLSRVEAPNRLHTTYVPAEVSYLVEQLPHCDDSLCRTCFGCCVRD